uniref:Uncharacterized protein n=1 Tax=Anguilla anguilla TaxID=7936 RepID=A0A0E9V4U5_ANGAN
MVSLQPGRTVYPKYCKARAKIFNGVMDHIH